MLRVELVLAPEGRVELQGDAELLLEAGEQAVAAREEAGRVGRVPVLDDLDVAEVEFALIPCKIVVVKKGRVARFYG